MVPERFSKLRGKHAAKQSGPSRSLFLETLHADTLEIHQSRDLSHRTLSMQSFLGNMPKQPPRPSELRKLCASTGNVDTTHGFDVEKITSHTFGESLIEKKGPCFSPSRERTQWIITFFIAFLLEGARERFFTGGPQTEILASQTVSLLRHKPKSLHQ